MPFPVDIRFIHRAAEKLGVQFPASYMARMQRTNGGDVACADDDWRLFPIFDDSDKSRLKRTCNDVVRETLQARQWPGFPHDAVAIASNDSGGFLVFLPDDTRQRLADRVYLWDHEAGQLRSVAEDLGELCDDDSGDAQRTVP